MMRSAAGRLGRRAAGPPGGRIGIDGFFTSRPTTVICPNQPTVHDQHQPSLLVLISVSARDFRPSSFSVVGRLVGSVGRFSAVGRLAPCNQSIASGESKACFYGFCRVSIARSFPRVWRVWGLRSPGAASSTALRAVLGLSEPSKQSTAADGGSLDGNQSVATSRCRFKKNASLARSQSKSSG
jgi:hypothetical protein